MKQANHYAAFKNVGAAVVIRTADAKLVARVFTHYEESTVTVTIYNYGERDEDDKFVQTGRASGYGYDKRTAAMAGMKIDGIEITDHCARRDEDGNPRPAGLSIFELSDDYEVIHVI